MPTFLEEDGTGIENATSYVSVAFSEEYLGVSWAASTEAKQTALMAGAEYADILWGPKLKGVPLLTTQGLEMPRTGMRDRYGKPVTGIPLEWQKAVCLYASYANAGTLYPTNQSTAKEIKSESVTVGPITTSTTYQGAALATSFLRFPLADRFARQYTYSGAGGGGVTR